MSYIKNIKNIKNLKLNKNVYIVRMYYLIAHVIPKYELSSSILKIRRSATLI